MWKTKTKSRTNGYGVAKVQRANYNSVSGMSAKSGTGWWALRKAAFDRDGGMCVVCRRLGTLVKAVEIHHITSLRTGGSNTISNLISLCITCHNKRHRHLFRTR